MFQPLGGARRPIIAGLAVFGFSAVMHEYMVFVSLERFDGRMLGFFALHGMVTMLYTMVAKLGRTTAVPQPIAVAIHFVWFIATAPLFFGPVDEIFGLTEWSLSAMFWFAAA